VHLSDEAFKDDLDDVILRSRQAGLNGLLAISVDAGTARLSQIISQKFRLPFTAGIHPSEALSCSADAIREIESILNDPLCLAVGEIGLDKYWPEPPFKAQVEVFRQMLGIALKLEKPVVIHQRSAAQEVIDVLSESGKGVRGVFHCFSGDADYASEVIARGFYVSVAGNVTYKNSRLPQVLKTVPLDRLLLETDAPYLSPGKLRGKRNEPVNVLETARKVAEVMGIGLEELGEATTANAVRLFGREIVAWEGTK
jgi:TatD DNase family protein